MLLLSVEMKLSVIILTIYVLMGSTSGNCPNCPDGELNIRPAKIDVTTVYHHSYKFLNDPFINFVSKNEKGDSYTNK